MSRMNAAWSDEPPWAEAVPAIFKEPMTIAFGGAILAHAIFFLGLPVVVGSEKQPDVQPVATTILTDQDKAQIPPDLSQSQFPAGALLPGTNNGLTMPPISSGTMPPAGSTNIVPGSGFSFDQPVYTPPTINDNSAQLAEIRRQQQEADRQAKIAKELIAAKDAADKKVRDQTPATEGIQPGMTPSPADLGVNTSAPPPVNTQPDTPSKPVTPPTQKNTPQPSRPSDVDIIAAAPNTYEFDSNGAGSETSQKPDAFSKWYAIDPKAKEIYDRNAKLFEEEREPEKKISPQPTRFSVDTPTKTLPYPTQIGNQPIAVIPDYAKKVQEKKGYGTAFVQIAINGKGEFVSEPNIMQSTGYKVLDQYVIAYVKSRKFPVSGRGKLYFMEVPIDPPVNKPTA